MRTVVHAKSKPLALKADDAWTSRPDHLDPGTIIEPHLPQAMDHIARAQDFSDAPPLSCAESTERNEDQPEFPSLLPDPMLSCVGLAQFRGSVAMGRPYY